MANSLLMVHGVGCLGDVWDRMRGDFEAAGWTCDTPSLFPDLRVKTDPPPADLAKLTLDDYVEEILKKAQEITERDDRKPVIIGHSMGGLIAQKLAEAGAVRAAILLTPAQPKGCTVTDVRVLRTFWNILKVGRKNVPGGVFKVGPQGFSWGVLNCVEQERHAEIYAEAVFDSGLVYQELSEPGPIDEQKVRVPTLTIGAKKDRATVIKAVRKVALKYGRSGVSGDYLEYPNHGHWIVDEPGTEKVSKDILAWLDKRVT